MSEQFKYDVAISFLQEDEALAKQLSSILAERLSVFVYYDRQKDIAGTDGEQTFNRVYGSESRIVVVLHRPNWGETPWTRIECTAIRNRAYDHGYDFLTIIPTGQDLTVPKWLPKTRLWIGLDRWGIESTAAAIESRVQEAGGTPTPQSPEDRAAKLSRHKQAEELRINTLYSREGYQHMAEELSNLYKLIESRAEAISASNQDIKISATKCEHKRFNFHSWGYHVYLNWEPVILRSNKDAALSIRIFIISRIEPFRREEPELLNEIFFVPDLRLPDTYGWSSSSSPCRFYSTPAMADYCLNLLIDVLNKYKPSLLSGLNPNDIENIPN